MKNNTKTEDDNMEDFNYLDYDWYCDSCGEELDTVDTFNMTATCPCCGAINIICIENVRK